MILRHVLLIARVNYIKSDLDCDLQYAAVAVDFLERGE